MSYIYPINHPPRCPDAVLSSSLCAKPSSPFFVTFLGDDSFHGTRRRSTNTQCVSNLTLVHKTKALQNGVSEQEVRRRILALVED